MRSFVPAVMIALALVSGCVTLGSHEELQRAQGETQQRLAEAQLDTAADAQKLERSAQRELDLKQALVVEETKSAELGAHINKLLKMHEERERALMAEVDKQQGELAQLIKDRSALKGSVFEMKTALDELAKRKAEADKRITEYRGMLSRFKSLIDAGKLKVKIVDGRMVVALASDILFASASAALSKEGKANLAEVGALLAQIAERRFQVEGHTDNVPIRSEQFPSNWELASARALTVLKTMVDAGLPAARVSAASFGDSVPAVPNNTPEGKSQNRRIEIVVVPDLSSLPGFDELQRVGS